MCIHGDGQVLGIIKSVWQRHMWSQTRVPGLDHGLGRDRSGTGRARYGNRQHPEEPRDARLKGMLSHLQEIIHL